MLTQQRIEDLLAMPKVLADRAPIPFPMVDDLIQLHAKSTDGREAFIFDVNRKGKIKLSKCTYQKRYAVVEILLRLDIDGPPHTNPDGVEIPCPHLHVYREGYGTQWAIPVPNDFSDTTDLVLSFREFLKYSKVDKIPEVQRSIN